MPLDASGFYANLRDGVTLSLLKKYGFQAAIQVKTGEVYDPTTGTITTPAQWTVFPCWAIYGGASSGSQQSNDSKSLTRVIKKDAYLDASTLSIIPTPDDLFQDENGNTFDILTVAATDPGGVTVLWQITMVK